VRHFHDWQRVRPRPRGRDNGHPTGPVVGRYPVQVGRQFLPEANVNACKLFIYLIALEDVDSSAVCCINLRIAHHSSIVAAFMEIVPVSSPAIPQSLEQRSYSLDLLT